MSQIEAWVRVVGSSRVKLSHILACQVDDLSQVIQLSGVIESSRLSHQVESLRQAIISSEAKLTWVTEKRSHKNIIAGDYFKIWFLHLIMSYDICTVSTVF